LIAFALAVAATAFLGPPAHAQSATLTLGVGAPVTTLTYDLSPDPTSSPTVAASPASFDVNVTTDDVAGWVLTIEASNTYLDMATRSINCNNISWTATGTGYRNGILSGVSAQTVGQAAGSGSWTGSLSFVMANQWTYVAGSYSDTIVYTLTAI
jgi:hypothetical protein